MSDEVTQESSGTHDEPWDALEVRAGSWLSEQVRLLAAEEGFAD